MDRGKKSFVLYFDYREHLALLNDEERGQLLMALFDYGEHGMISELNGAPRMAFSFISAQMDRDAQKYAETCKRNRENGSKGGRPAKAKETKVNRQQPKKTERFSDKPRKADTDNDNDKDTDTEKDKDMIHHPPLADDGSHVKIKPDIYQTVYDYYLSLDLIKHKQLTNEMRKAIDKAKRSGYSLNDMKQLLDRHTLIVEASKDDGDFKVGKRPITEFFGQKVHGGTVLICSEYADDGKKWLRYQSGEYGQMRSKSANSNSYEGQRKSERNADYDELF